MLKKINIKYKKGKLTQIRFFNIAIWEYGISEGKKFWKFPFIKNKSCSKAVFYLKINKFDWFCFQYWLNVIEYIGADYYIICDDNYLEDKVLNSFTFFNSNIKFIKSSRIYFHKFVKNLKLPKCWNNPAYAHLTTFLHAKKNKIREFWNIDADDTIFMIEPENLAKQLNIISEYADKNHIDLFSFDMHYSFSNSSHWSYGITKVQNPSHILEIMQNTNIKEWEQFKDTNLKNNPTINIDWYTTFLKKTKRINAQTFYIDNIYFLHNNAVLCLPNTSLCLYKNDMLEYPIFKYVYKLNNVMISYVPTAKNSIKFDFGFNTNDSLKFLHEYYIRIFEKIAAADACFGEKYE